MKDTTRCVAPVMEFPLLESWACAFAGTTCALCRAPVSRLVALASASKVYLLQQLDSDADLHTAPRGAYHWGVAREATGDRTRTKRTRMRGQPTAADNA